GNSGDLRYCIGLMNGDVGLTDTIAFDAGTFATPQTIYLGSTIAITNSVIINGPGAANAIVDGGGAVQLFAIDTANLGRTVSISGLTLTHGQASQGGVFVMYNDSVTLSNVVIDSNTASSSGGAILDNGTTAASVLTITDSVVTNNSAGSSGGGVI